MEEDNRGVYILELEAKVRILEAQIDRLKKWIFDEIGRGPPESLLSENVETYIGDQDHDVSHQDQIEDNFIGPDFIGDDDAQEFALENVKMESIEDNDENPDPLFVLLQQQEQCEDENERVEPQLGNEINVRYTLKRRKRKMSRTDPPDYGKEIDSNSNSKYANASEEIRQKQTSNKANESRKIEPRSSSLQKISEDLDSPSVSCKICQKTFKFKCRLKAHEKTHQVKKSFDCSCGKSYARREDLTKHSRKCEFDKTGEKTRNVCPVCNKEFKFYSRLREHMNIHDKNRERNYLCSFCGKSFYEKNHVRVHISECHPEPEQSNKPKPDDSVEQLCGLCGKTYKNERKLTRHLQYHERICQSFICSFCGVTLNSEISYKSHMNLHTKEETWRCTYPECSGSDKVYFTSQNLNAHIRRIHNKNASIFHCDFPGCTRNFKNKSALKWHKDIHNKEKMYKCSYCQKFIRSTYALRSHIAKYHRQDRSGPDYPFKCPILTCGQSFNEERRLKVHFDSAHCEKPKLTCPHKETHGCKNEFLNKKTLHLHLKWRHQLAGIRPFVCQIDNCNKRFQINAQLTAHQETHMNKEDRKYPCKYCPDTFSSRTMLGGHIRKLHRDARNLRLKCPIDNCGQTFSSTRFLEEHVETHNPDYDPYKFKCSICFKGYKVATERNRHEKVVHQTERPFVCHCGKDFKQLQHLKRHKRQAHEGIEGKMEARKRKVQGTSSDFLHQDELNY